MKRSTRQRVWDSKSRQVAGSLFERLVSDEDDITLPDYGDPFDARIRSIKRHLVNLLNTRTGGSASSPDLGVTDFNDCVSVANDMSKHVAASIRECIENFEPRAKNVAVGYLHDPDRPLELKFSISVDIPIGDKEKKVQIDLLMDDARKARML